MSRLLTLLAEGVAYQLRDRFSTALAAGSVNASPADPGPGNRAVTDTESKLSVAGGQLVCAGGKATPATGDPGIWWPVRARVAGRTLLLRATTTGGTDWYAGWDSNQATTLKFGFRANGANCQAYNPAVHPALTIAAHDDNQEYEYALVLRAAGTYWLRRPNPSAGGTYLLLYANLIDNTASMYPGIANNNRPYTADELRVPEPLWLPSVLACDTFTRADGALGSTEMVGPDGQSAPALAWDATVGTWAVATNVAACSALAVDRAIARVNAGTPNVFGEVTLARAGGTVGVVVRYVDAANYLRIVHNGTNVQLVQRLAGVETTPVNVAAAFGAGVLRWCCDADKLRLYYNDVLIGSEQTMNAAFAASTTFGLWTDNIGNTLDAFTLWPRGNEGQHASLGAL